MENLFYMEKYIEHFQTWQKVWSIKSIQHISVFAYVYVLVLLGGEAKNHALPRGGGGVLCSQSSIFKGGHLPRYRVFYQGRDPIRRVVRLYNWANRIAIGRFSERENWTKIKVLRGGAGHWSGFHLKLWEIRMIDRISSIWWAGKDLSNMSFFEGWEAWKEGVLKDSSQLWLG